MICFIAVFALIILTVMVAVSQNSVLYQIASAQFNSIESDSFLPAIFTNEQMGELCQFTR
jgi:hypothetical protein